MIFEAIAGWASIISLGITLLSLYLIGTIRGSIINFRRKKRVQQLIAEIKTIPDDASPLSKASRSKFESLQRKLPFGYMLFWTKKSEAIRSVRLAIKSENIPSLKDCIEDYISHFEDL